LDGGPISFYMEPKDLDGFLTSIHSSSICPDLLFFMSPIHLS
jgi:hypothetical protein